MGNGGLSKRCAVWFATRAPAIAGFVLTLAAATPQRLRRSPSRPTRSQGRLCSPLRAGRSSAVRHSPISIARPMSFRSIQRSSDQSDSVPQWRHCQRACERRQRHRAGNVRQRCQPGNTVRRRKCGRPAGGSEYDVGAGFFAYFNSGLNLPQLFNSTDLSENTADLKIIVRMTNLTGQSAELANFTQANFAVT